MLLWSWDCVQDSYEATQPPPQLHTQNHTHTSQLGLGLHVTPFSRSSIINRIVLLPVTPSPQSPLFKDNKQKCFDGEGEGGPGLREPWSRPVDSPRSGGSPGLSGHMVKGGSPTLRPRCRPLDTTAFLTEFRMAMVLGDMGLLSQRHQ